MKIKYVREISDPNELLILEINDRVNQLLYEDELSDTDKAVLKIDRESMVSVRKGVHVTAISNNLIEKIDYLLSESE